MRTRKGKPGLDQDEISRLLNSKAENSSSSSDENGEDSFSDNSFIEGDAYQDDYEQQEKKPKAELEKGQKPLSAFVQSIKKNVPKPAIQKPSLETINEDDFARKLCEDLMEDIPKKKTKKKGLKKKAEFDDIFREIEEMAKKEEQVKKIEKPIEKIQSGMTQIEKPVYEKKYQQISVSQIVNDAPVKPKEIVLEIEKVEEESNLEFIESSEVGAKGKPNLNTDGSLDMFIFHTHEESGNLFLFGKNRNKNTFITTCVRIKNPLYYLYFKPHDDMEEQCMDEAHRIARICGGSCVNCTEQNMLYSFGDTTIKHASNWIVASYSSNCDLSKVPTIGITYSHVFGMTSTLAENFLIKRKIWGPQWLQIKNIEESTRQVSLCPMFDIENIESIDLISRQIPVPPFNICSIAVRTAYNEKKKSHEVFLISMTIYNNWDIEKFETYNGQKKIQTTYNFICSPSFINLSTEFTHEKHPQDIIVLSNERELLGKFVETLESFDIDFISSYGLTTFEGNLIFQRLCDLKADKWFRYGRLIKKIPMKNTKLNVLTSFPGRLPVDLRVSCSEFLRSKANDLSSIVQQELKKERQLIDHYDIVSEISDKARIMNLIRYNIRDTDYVLQLMKKIQVLPLTLQISQLSACAWSRVLMGMASYRSESLLAHSFSNRNYVIPDKVKLAPGAFHRETAKYQGGYVLQPKKGFYENCIMLLDFNSLYPSIIREYNLCFTTIDWENPDPFVCQKNKREGVLPMIMKHLLEERTKVRTILKTEKDEIEQQRLNIKQLALKILANAMYGYLGFKGSRFQATKIAEMITSRGRSILNDTVDKIEKVHNYNIIYGDTDSVMVNSNIKDVKNALIEAQKISAEISKGYKHLRLGVDGIFMKMLLVSKKKYAALLYHEGGKPTQELKGLDMVRRDWCALTKSLSGFVINQFMTESDSDEAINSILTELERCAYMLRNNGEPPSETSGIEFVKKEKSLSKITKGQLIIYKALKKPISEYPSTKSLPHVAVAKKMIARGENVPQNATIPYIVTSPHLKNLDEKAMHPDEVGDVQSSDVEWYIVNQLYHPIWRLCEPFGGMDLSMVAHALGIRYNAPSNNDSQYNEQFNQNIVIPHLTELKYQCLNCTKDIIVISNLKDTLTCASCGYVHNWVPVANILTRELFGLLSNYSQTGFVCNAHLCDYETSQLPVSTLYPFHQNSYAEGRSCKGKLILKNSQIDVFNTYRYFQSLFISKDTTPEFIAFRDYMYQRTSKYLQFHGFSHVNIAMIFGKSIETHFNDQNETKNTD